MSGIDFQNGFVVGLTLGGKNGAICGGGSSGGNSVLNIIEFEGRPSRTIVMFNDLLQLTDIDEPA